MNQARRPALPIICPPRLKSGDTLGIAAPAGPFDLGLFEQGLQVLKAMGFGLKVPEGIFKRNGFLAGRDSERADIVNRLFADPEVHGILCARGGYGTTRLEPYLDWDTIQVNPKVFIGFSDITVMHHLIVSRCGFATLHGPMGTTLASASDDTRESFMVALTSSTPIVIAAHGAGVIQPGEGAGPVAGGNLSMICHLLGTPLQPDFKGRVLFIEEVNEAPYRIDRMLWQMRLAGCFRELAGLFFGRFVDCGNPQTITELIAAHFKESTYPVMTDFPIGHGRVNHTVAMGLKAVLTTDPPQLQYALPATV